MDIGERKWLYVGVIINEDAQKTNILTLSRFGFKIKDDWKMYNHHMTIAFNDQTEEAQSMFNAYKGMFRQHFILTVDGIDVSDDAIVVRVAFEYQTMNKNTYIAIAKRQKEKAINIEDITKWYSIPSYTITGQLLPVFVNN